MKFNSQICTTKIQSERLLALGLKKDTADMFRPPSWGGDKIIGYYAPNVVLFNDHFAENHNDLPAWSLNRLIEILDIWYLELNFNEFNNAYDQIISYLEERIKGGFINKEYLE